MPKSHMTPIKDLVHGYISFSMLEKVVIDHKHFQRLHFVLQNSSTYTAYPNNKNSRFTHSLGVAHLAGLMYGHSICNASRSNLLGFLHSADLYVRELLERTGLSATDARAGWNQEVGFQFAFQHKPMDGTECIHHLHEECRTLHIESDPYFLINTFGVALRICGLVHDIGHLPMSHIFESALSTAETIFDRYGDAEPAAAAFRVAYAQVEKDLFAASASLEPARRETARLDIGITDEQLERISKKLHVHERRGLVIFDKIVEDIRNSDIENRGYYQIVFRIARAILFSKRSTTLNEKYKFLHALSDVIASELDADRLDYTLRDPLESGIMDRTFDVERLVSQYVLTKGEDAGDYHFCPSYKALSVVESFFHNRFLNYRYIIYHHSVVRMNCVVEEILKQLIRICFIDGADGLLNILAQYEFVKVDRIDGKALISLLPNFGQKTVDDTWLRSLLVELSNIISMPGHERYRDLRILIETFLFRKTTNMLTIWKSEIDYKYSSERFKNAPNPYVVLASEKAKIQETIDSNAKSYRKIGVFVFYYEMTPKIYNKNGSIFYIVDDKGRLWRPEDVSPYLNSFDAIAENIPNIHISLLADNLKSRPDCDEIRLRLEDAVLSTIGAVRKIPGAPAPG